MIRERRDEDIARLCAILEALEPAAGVLAGQNATEWLTEHDAEQSWVFDMAPVNVAPTKNVVGHVEIYQPADVPAMFDGNGYTGNPAAERLAIRKLFVGPTAHQYGIARYLLKESVKYVQRRGKLPVLDVYGHAFVSNAFCRRFGFEQMPAGEPGVGPMIYTR